MRDASPGADAGGRRGISLLSMLAYCRTEHGKHARKNLTADSQTANTSTPHCLARLNCAYHSTMRQSAAVRQRHRGRGRLADGNAEALKKYLLLN